MGGIRMTYQIFISYIFSAALMQKECKQMNDFIIFSQLHKDKKDSHSKENTKTVS